MQQAVGSTDNRAGFQQAPFKLLWRAEIRLGELLVGDLRQAGLELLGCQEGLSG